ncbi:MAG: 3'-5' exonuclease [Rubripirellula sp.]|nr:3'-5' exonuclease [Rubripirellula sp.]
MAKVSYLVFDVESVADGQLISQVRYPNQGLNPKEAITAYQDELLENKGTTFIPHTYQVPTAVVIAKVSEQFELLDIVSLDEPAFRPHVITENFWRGWEMYHKPIWVTFNGRSFDLPLMELAAFRFGISVPDWFRNDGYRSPRNRFNLDTHLDLQDVLTNFGAARCNGGLNLIAQMLGKPGKIGLSGDRVQEEYDAGNQIAISDYCRCDVLDTYFVFLRTQLLLGKITIDREREIIHNAKSWIESRKKQSAAYRDYLDHWQDWTNPWSEPSTQVAEGD